MMKTLSPGARRGLVSKAKALPALAVCVLATACLHFSFSGPAPARDGRGTGPDAPKRSDQTGALAFVNVNVVPMDGERVLGGQTVVVRDGRIAQIGPANKVKVPASAVRIDGRGKYLMPGLTDAHVHLRNYDEADMDALL